MSKFKVGDKVKILSLNKITCGYGDSFPKRTLIGEVVEITHVSGCTPPYITVKNNFNFDFADIELDQTFEISKDRSYKNSGSFGCSLKYIGNAFISEAGVLVVSDDNGKVTGTSNSWTNAPLNYTIVEEAPIVLPEMYELSESSLISSVGYDMADKLFVKFYSDSIYEYSDVTIQEFHKLLSAKSAGIFFNDNIRNEKAFKRIS